VTAASEFLALTVPLSAPRVTPSLDFVVTESQRWRSWDSITISLHGVPAPASIFAFGGSWVSKAGADPNSHFIVIGRGSEPADTRLVRGASQAYGSEAHQSSRGRGGRTRHAQRACRELGRRRPPGLGAATRLTNVGSSTTASRAIDKRVQ
jgi:hypothetical protein